ncbi:hypothetical protein CXF70_00580 [Planomicrobium sp. MB-3u-38]|nr:hypothetical protein CXF70_00580 [Planomicrobium sp. MB-3u-38]
MGCRIFCWQLKQEKKRDLIKADSGSFTHGGKHPVLEETFAGAKVFSYQGGFGRGGVESTRGDVWKYFLYYFPSCSASVEINTYARLESFMRD